MLVCSRVSYSEVATSLVPHSLLSHSRFSANPDGRIVPLCSAQPRSAIFEPVGESRCSFCKIPSDHNLFSARVPFVLIFASCYFQHSLLFSSIPKYGWCSNGVSIQAFFKCGMVCVRGCLRMVRLCEVPSFHIDISIVSRPLL